jgi:hypothetical protein
MPLVRHVPSAPPRVRSVRAGACNRSNASATRCVGRSGPGSQRGMRYRSASVETALPPAMKPARYPLAAAACATRASARPYGYAISSIAAPVASSTAARPLEAPVANRLRFFGFLRMNPMHREGIQGESSTDPRSIFVSRWRHVQPTEDLEIGQDAFSGIHSRRHRRANQLARLLVTVHADQSLILDRCSQAFSLNPIAVHGVHPLLTPADVDPDTRYRRYRESQLRRFEWFPAHRQKL